MGSDLRNYSGLWCRGASILIPEFLARGFCAHCRKDATMTAVSLKSYQDRVKEVLDLTTDNDRLRKALSDILKDGPIWRAQRIAKEALARAGDGTS